jgi:hypothetical protein
MHGCGQNVHGKCMSEWVQHQKNTNRVRSHLFHCADLQSLLINSLRTVMQSML